MTTKMKALDRPWRFTGRGPAGNVRNFAAMKAEKFMAEAQQVLREGNDLEAVDVVMAEMRRRMVGA